MRQAAENIIRQEIEFMFGRRIVSSRDCIQLCEEIFRVTKSRLNPNTLRRFFGLVKTVYSPAPATLQILCNYCGFSTIEDIEHKIVQKDLLPAAVDQKTLISYLVNLFKEAPVKTGNDSVFISVVKQTILFLHQHVELIERFQSQVAKTKNGCDYYFETFVDIDHLNSFYGDGLRYYLAETSGRPEAQVFGHSLLAFRYWLTADDVNLERHYQKVQNFIELLPAVNSRSAARHFACLLYYCQVREVPAINTIMEIHAYCDEWENSDQREQMNFEVIIAEALILAGTYEEGIFYTELALKKNLVIENIEEHITQFLYLLQAFALYKIGDIANAAQVYEQIRPSAFNFLGKMIQTILYGFLTEALKKRNNDDQWKQTLLLIQETGFIRLKKMINPL